ncbi:MAG: alpha/beta hydrolase [Oscillibacter sp.]|jgi:alpha-beta hydrolase superfamily lysophospholipase|nr:alpha/beta hydrolase [Oscillibacter sp.]
MSIHEISFPSANGRDTVKGWIYTPIGQPRGVVQLMHGFGEHSRRYLHMIDKFLEAGFVVSADDHIGHGKTGFDSGTLGDPGTSGKDGWRVYLQDERSLHDLTVKDFPALPYFVFGHSWGSMLARGYAALYGGDLRGLALCGVVSQMKGCELLLRDPALMGKMEAQVLSGRGGDKGGSFMAGIFGTLTERIPDAASPNDWIANDPRIVADHAGDPFNCFDVTVQLLYDFVRLYAFIETPAWAAQVPAGLPAYLISGDCDPCGNYGEGLYHTANLLAEAGHPVQVHAYSGYRHEIHNQRDIRDGVEDGIVAFLSGLSN